MKIKDLAILAGAAVAVYLLLRSVGGGDGGSAGQYWVTAEGNTAFPEAARTGGGVWL